MAEAFLKKLFEESEVVTECPVCHDPYGTLNSKGKTEREIRLPCGHLIGSACAHKWFMLNNTCPQCRKELYPAQPDPSDDQEIIEDATPDSPAADEAPESDENSESSSDEGYENAESSSDEDSTDSSEDEQFDLDERLGEGEQFDDDAEFFDDRILEHMARLFPDQDVFDEVLDLAEPIAEAMKSLHHRYTDGYGLAAMAATSVFLASHLVHEPRSAVEVEREILQGYPLVSELYQRQYDVKEDLIDGLGLDMNTLAFPPLFPNSESSESSESDDDED